MLLKDDLALLKSIESNELQSIARNFRLNPDEILEPVVERYSLSKSVPSRDKVIRHLLKQARELLPVTTSDRLPSNAIEVRHPLTGENIVLEEDKVIQGLEEGAVGYRNDEKKLYVISQKLKGHEGKVVVILH